jgi:hypothetical protein
MDELHIPIDLYEYFPTTDDKPFKIVGYTRKSGFNCFAEKIYSSVVREIVDLEKGLMPRQADIYFIITERWNDLPKREQNQWKNIASRKNKPWIHGTTLSI